MECHIRYKTVIKEMAHTRHQSLVALFFILCSLFFSPAGAQVGKWRTYMSYYEPQQIVKASNSLFVRASNGMYQYNLTDHSITTFDKTQHNLSLHRTPICVRPFLSLLQFFFAP